MIINPVIKLYNFGYSSGYPALWNLLGLSRDCTPLTNLLVFHCDHLNVRGTQLFPYHPPLSLAGFRLILCGTPNSNKWVHKYKVGLLQAIFPASCGGNMHVRMNMRSGVRTDFESHLCHWLAVGLWKAPSLLSALGSSSPPQGWCFHFV